MSFMKNLSRNRNKHGYPLFLERKSKYLPMDIGNKHIDQFSPIRKYDARGYEFVSQFEK